MIRFERVSKVYERRGRSVDALKPADINIAAGEFVAVIGSSGSGKTTLLSIIGGMLTPTSGTVRFEGESLYDLSSRRRSRIRSERIGFVFQSFNLIPWLSALENVQLPLCVYGTDPRIQRSRAKELLERFGLEDRMDHKPSELSVGQQQRVALARTLVNNPALILADEPTGNLDPLARQLVLDCFTQMQQDGRTIVMVTHDHAAAQHADRVLRILDGAVSRAAQSEIAGAA